MTDRSDAAGGASAGPLDGFLIVDLLDEPTKGASRLYAELGARVVRVSRDDGGSPAHGEAEAIASAVADAGKELVALATDPQDRQAQWEALLGKADLVLRPRTAPRDWPAVDMLVPRSCVVMTVSMFGSDNACSDWQATDPVFHALSSELSRSGIAGRPPLLPPGRLASACASSQATYVGVMALYAAQVSGRGDRIDFSMLDAAVQALDPGFGLAGSATLGRSARMLPPGRPAIGTLYPIFPCADGHVRLCLLAPRQWRNMWQWLGEPAQFAAPAFDNIETRQKSEDLTRTLAQFCKHRSRAELESEGALRGIPISGVLSLSECLATAHVRARGVIAPVDLPTGQRVAMPQGVLGIDRHAAPPPRADARPAGAPAGASAERPLAGLKVIDLGVIVVGGEQSRLLADLGADVIKIESASFPDGTRHSYLPTGLSVGFAAGHRNKRSLGLDLRQPEGKRLFLRLAREADVILSNFKPGTMAALGFDDDTIHRVNPGAIMVESSAFGANGPWAGRMGYGPLVRAASGLTSQWIYPDDPVSFSDSVTIYPDHAAARYGAIAVLALLVRRLRTGRGGTASIAQMDVMLDQFAPEIACIAGRIDQADGPVDAPWGVYRARGEDEWCVVTVRDDRDWRALARAIGKAHWTDSARFASRRDRLRNKDEIERDLAAWMIGQDADAAMRVLQDAGVPAARMLRIADLPQFDYFKDRRLFRVERHPHLAEDVISERFHAVSANLAALPSSPAPLMGEHSAAILRDWLDLSRAEIDVLFATAVVQGVPPDIAQMLEAGDGRGEALPA